jgi:hypothetical protein
MDIDSSDAAGLTEDIADVSKPASEIDELSQAAGRSAVH